MQTKRKAPELPMVYWSADGWEAELLYQATRINEQGHSVTTYHNRLTVVFILDVFGNYPIGYAIGDQENTGLITAAMRNAFKHTQELFGSMHTVLQLQTDNFSRKALTPIYEAASLKYTPARVKNSKSKRVEPYNKYFNKTYCQMYARNWSGFGITTDKKKQPNTEYLNKVRHNFPTRDECIAQLEQYIAMDRKAKIENYYSKWDALPSADKHVLSQHDYLYHFGETTGYANSLSGPGVIATIEKVKYAFDSFDINFRQHRDKDWALKFDPTDLSTVLAVNCTRDAKDKIKEIIGTLRFELQNKYIQPMDLYDRKEGDSTELAQIEQFNKEMKQQIITGVGADRALVESVFADRPELNHTLAKLQLVDSMGQHKIHRKETKALNTAQKLIKRELISIEATNERTWKE